MGLKKKSGSLYSGLCSEGFDIIILWFEVTIAYKSASKESIYLVVMKEKLTFVTIGEQWR